MRLLFILIVFGLLSCEKDHEIEYKQVPDDYITTEVGQIWIKQNIEYTIISKHQYIVKMINEPDTIEVSYLDIYENYNLK